MKISKKLLSLLLAVVMIVATLSITAFAWTNTGAEVASDVNIKYTVEKVAKAPTASALSQDYEGDDIYAVTVWAKCNNPIPYVTATIQYEKAHFAPICLNDDSGLYPGDAQDTNYTDAAGDASIQNYSLGSFADDANMYTAKGAVTTSSRSAVMVGIGNAAHPGISKTFELVSPDHPSFARYSAGVDTGKYGIVFGNINAQAKAKSAYFNSYPDAAAGIIGANPDWADMFTVYFQRLPGVTDADCVGDVFGAIVPGSYNMDVTNDTSGNFYFTNATTAMYDSANFNLVSNAVVEAATSPVYSKTSQIRYDGPLANAGDATSAPFSIRSRAAMTADDFASICGTDEAAKIAITDVGFVYVANGTADVATAEAVVAEVTGEGASTANVGYYKKPVQQIQVKDGEYIWTCLIEKANYEDTASAVAYIVVNGTTYLFDAAYATDFSELYDTWAHKIPTA